MVLNDKNYKIINGFSHLFVFTLAIYFYHIFSHFVCLKQKRRTQIIIKLELMKRMFFIGIKLKWLCSLRLRLLWDFALKDGWVGKFQGFCEKKLRKNDNCCSCVGLDAVFIGFSPYIST